VFWVITPSQLVHNYQHFDGLYCFNLQGPNNPRRVRTFGPDDEDNSVHLWLFTIRQAVDISERLEISAVPLWEPRISKSSTTTNFNGSEEMSIRTEACIVKPSVGLREIAGRYGTWLSSLAGSKEPVVRTPVAPLRDADGLATVCYCCSSKANFITSHIEDRL
jgi:hypothetical protein